MERPQEEMSFLDHLEVLRWHVIRSIVVVITVALLAFFFKSLFYFSSKLDSLFTDFHI